MRVEEVKVWFEARPRRVQITVFVVEILLSSFGVAADGGEVVAG